MITVWIDPELKSENSGHHKIEDDDVQGFMDIVRPAINNEND